MTKVRKKEWDSLVDAVEAPYIFRQPKTEKVDIADGQIQVLVSPVFDTLPLEHSDLFMSFAKLTAHGEPTEAKIRRWVYRFGLPKWSLPWRPSRPELIKETEIDLPDGTEGVELTFKSPTRVADSMSVGDFIDEARYAHDLLRLYLNYRGHNYPALRARVKAPESRLDHDFSDAYRMNQKKWGLSAGQGSSKEIRDGATRIATRFAIGDLVDELVDGVRLRVGVQNVTGPAPSCECPNLPSAIYLQFYWLFTRNKPIRHCEYCGQAFELTREDRYVCSPSCRSGLRYQRRKDKEKDTLT